MDLSNSITILSGIGPKKAQLLKENGIQTCLDLLKLIPKGYEKVLVNPSLRHLTEGQHVTILGKVVQTQFLGFGRKKRFSALIENESGCIPLMFFNAQYINTKHVFAKGNEITVCGKVVNFSNRLQLVHPKSMKGNHLEFFGGIKALYPEYSFISSTELKKHIGHILLALGAQPPQEFLPPQLIESHQLLPMGEVYFALHGSVTENTDEALETKFKLFSRAKRRLAFEEIASFMQTLREKRARTNLSDALSFKHSDPSKLINDLFDFKSTGAQTRVIEEICSDLALPHPMSRLLQGDVGAGKTAVAAAAAMVVLQNGAQVAFMAPTQILATQHHKTLEPIFNQRGFETLFLTGDMTLGEKKRAHEKIASGAANIIVGTHAVISESVKFRKLGLAIIDEQHRFGVSQRQVLQKKQIHQKAVPHLLLMSATPIPRSLAMTAYGDLNISILDEKPQGRQPVATYLLTGRSEDLVEKCLKKVLQANEKAYVIYPLIDASEKVDLKNAVEAFQTLQGIFGSKRIALIHGRMKDEEKMAAMKEFKSGSKPILVSTTVVEVGVDVADATTIIIVHPERFGLSQLHQLRGRVGRSDLKSRCYLLSEGRSPERLHILEQSQDGFKIAEEDLRLRGPGDFLGTRQSGLPHFYFFNFIEHSDLIEPAKTYCSMNSNS